MNGRRSKKYAELELTVKSIEGLLGHSITISGANGGVRLESEDGSEDISPRLSVPDLLDWCYAFRKGIFVGKNIERKRAERVAKVEAALEADHKASTKV